MANEPANAPKKDDPAKQHYVRTFAQDMARLSGKPMTSAAQVPASAPKPSRKPPEETKPEPEKPPAPTPPPAYIIPKAPSTDESREAVLARLKQYAGAPAAPAPVSMKPRPAPSTDEKSADVLARLQANAKRAEPPPPIPLAQKPSMEKAPERIHTYTSDFADHLDEKEGSAFSVLAAQADAAPQLTTVRFVDKPKFPVAIAAGFALLLLGMGAIVAAFVFMPKEIPVPEELVVPSLVFADDYFEVAGDGPTLRAALTAPRMLAEGETLVAYLTRASTTPEGASVFVPAEGGALIAALGLPAPDVLLRSILPASTAGVIRTRNEVAPFFLLRVDSYERSFAGMLDWEPRMAQDLAEFYPELPPAALPVLMGTSTAGQGASSTTPPIEPASAFSFSSGFSDDIVDTRDVRVLRDSEGRSVMLYGFYSKDTIVIARNESAFIELVRRMAAARSQ